MTGFELLTTWIVATLSIFIICLTVANSTFKAMRHMLESQRQLARYYCRQANELMDIISKRRAA